MSSFSDYSLNKDYIIFPADIATLLFYRGDLPLFICVCVHGRVHAYVRGCARAWVCALVCVHVRVYVCVHVRVRTEDGRR